MRTNGNHHPGRSVEFLSRLHDGELGAGERARFEGHRAHCAECRRAAVEFEDALSMFRSARSSPPRADLAARILRKVQSTNRPRVPFPLGFRIDLGWAALLATALLALLIATPIVVRRPESVPPPPGDLPPPVAETAPPRVVAAPPVPAEAKRENRRARLADAKPPESAVEEPGKEAGAPPIAAARPADRTESRAAAQSARERTSAEPAEESRAVAMAPEAGPVGGEGGVVSPLARAVPLKLTMEPIDGFGPAPALLSRSFSGTAQARGREFVVLVDSQGTVRKVSAHPSRKDRSRDELPAELDGDDEVAASIARLRFEPGNRPRRLLIRVE